MAERVPPHRALPRAPPPPPPCPPAAPPRPPAAPPLPPTAPPLRNPRRVPIGPPQLVKFTFSCDSKLILAQCVLEHNAHLAVHGQLDVCFEKVRATFLENLPPSTWTQHAVPSVKTLRDKFRVMMRARRNIDAFNAAASGISEEITELDQVLDDMTREKDSEDEEKKTKRDEASAREAGLTQTGLMLRAEASTRTQKESKEEKKERQAKRKRSRNDLEQDDDFNEIVRQELEQTRKQDRLSNDLRAQEIALMRETFEQDKLDRQALREQNAKQIEFMTTFINKFT